MSGAFRNRTQNGYDMFEVVSAIQKTIRRGMEYEAMYWALELVPKYELYLWRRLGVIVNEDIGIANPQILTLYHSLRTSYFEYRELGKDGSARLCLANMILSACRSPKSRLSDHFQCVVMQDRLHGIRLDIPDFALDKHTRAGRSMGRGVDHFRDVGTHLENEAPDVADPYRDKAFDYWGNDFIKTDWGKRSKKGGKSQAQDEPDYQQGSLFGKL